MIGLRKEKHRTLTISIDKDGYHIDMILRNHEGNKGLREIVHPSSTTGPNRREHIKINRSKGTAPLVARILAGYPEDLKTAGFLLQWVLRRFDTHVKEGFRSGRMLANFV